MSLAGIAPALEGPRPGGHLPGRAPCRRRLILTEKIGRERRFSISIWRFLAGVEFMPATIMIRKVISSPTEAYNVILMRRQASLDRQNFGVRRNFSIFIWRFLNSGKFILPIFILPGKIVQFFFGTT